MWPDHDLRSPAAANYEIACSRLDKTSLWRWQQCGLIS